jgi:L-fuconolactonase
MLPDHECQIQRSRQTFVTKTELHSILGERRANLNRREFLVAAAAVTTADTARSDTDPIPIIDTHLHLFDPTRPQGVPYPKVPNPPQQLPSQYREDVTPLGIVGGIKVEASPWVEDNLWVLEVIKNEPIIVGMIGNLNPTKPEFRENLDRYHRNKLFLGIRYGNVWEGDSLAAAIDSPEFIGNMKAFAQTGLTLEVANPRFDLIDATVRLTDKVPELRVVLGHLQTLPLPTAPDAMKSYSNNLRELRRRKVYAKVSGLPRPAEGQSPWAPASYKPMLDFIWDIFGEEFVVFAAGWSRTPQQPSPIERMKNNLKVFHEYVEGKGRPAAEKFFWKNSVHAFQWVRRDPNQPHLAAG